MVAAGKGNSDVHQKGQYAALEGHLVLCLAALDLVGCLVLDLLACFAHQLVGCLVHGLVGSLGYNGLVTDLIGHIRYAVDLQELRCNGYLYGVVNTCTCKY